MIGEASEAAHRPLGPSKRENCIDFLDPAPQALNALPTEQVSGVEFV